MGGGGLVRGVREHAHRLRPLQSAILHCVSPAAFTRGKTPFRMTAGFSYHSAAAHRTGHAGFRGWHFRGLVWQRFAMSTLTSDLQAALKQFDTDSATKLERLVRDAIALAQPSQAKPVEVDAKGWPVGHFEKYAGCLAGEQWDLPDDPPPEPTPDW